ncbi:aromatic ring-hydroxylating dioxygenase subunit alpha [Variovorax sp. GT1P44]|uniref:aromatic ring-hydroxylating dioxygenase subunit alpha n=1 Tax=Variovorax sp. GT1P44 TaxID=3443742 RepID=UPI003F485C9E
MIEKQLWHPVALVEDIANAPVAVRLLGEDLVLWRDGTGEVHAWADRCPHRGAKLSLGRVVQCAGALQLECPYHGWRFEAGGRCVHVPALPSFVPPASNHATTYGACDAGGLVWVRIDAPAEAESPVPVFAAEVDASMRKIDCGPYDVDTSAPRLIENFLDMAHFGFVHEDWLGARDMAIIDDYRVEATPNGLLATGCKAWQPRSTVNSTTPAQVEYTYEVTGPYTAVLIKVPDAASVGIDDYRESIALYICPVEHERCRVWFRFATSDFSRDEASVRAFQDTIFLQDKPVLESQSPKRLPLDLRAELHTLADKASSLYRRHLKTRGITFGVL